MSVLLSKQTQNVVTFTATHQSESTLGSCLEKPEYLCPGFASSLSLGRGQQSEWPFSAVDQMPSFLSPKPSNAPPSASASTWNESLSASYRAQEAWAAGSVPAGSVPLLSLPASMRVKITSDVLCWLPPHLLARFLTSQRSLNVLPSSLYLKPLFACLVIALTTS